MAANQKLNILSNASTSSLMPDPYIRQMADQSTGRDLEYCKSTDQSVHPYPVSVKVSELAAEIAPAKVKTAGTVTYAANTLVLFLGSSKSVHAVSARTPTPLTRRRLKLRKSLETTPVAWRLARFV